MQGAAEQDQEGGSRLAAVNAKLQELAELQRESGVLQQELATLQEQDASLQSLFCSSKSLARDATYWHGQLSDSGRLDAAAALAAAQARLQAKMPPAAAELAFALFKKVVS